MYIDISFFQAFYPIAKLMIRRVGDHEVCVVFIRPSTAIDATHTTFLWCAHIHNRELHVQAYSATRASEIGDGTAEVSTLPRCYLELLSKHFFIVPNTLIIWAFKYFFPS